MFIWHLLPYILTNAKSLTVNKFKDAFIVGSESWL